MTDSNKAGASGERRQPRLMDLQRAEEKCDQLAGEVSALRAEVSDLRKAVASSPFAGLEFDNVITALAYVVGMNQPGGVLDYQVKQRASHALRGLKALFTGDDSGLQDRPTPYVQPKASARLTHIQPSASESVGTKSQVQADLDTLKPSLIPEG